MKKLFVLLAAMITFTSTAFAEIGSLDKDLVFTPVTPCRIMDTRNAGAKSGILAAGSVRGFWGWSGSFTAQGGSATSCGTLQNTNEAAILVNFTVVTPDTGGYITAFPADVLDANKPLAATVNFTAGSVIGNNATVKLNQTGTGDDFKIYSTSNVHVVADIVGYYSKPVATALQTTSSSASLGVAASASFTFSSTACPTGYAVTGAGYNESINADGMVIWQITPRTAQNDALCRGRNPTASSANVTCTALCSRIPGR